MFAELIMKAGQHWGKPPGCERLVRMFWPPERCRNMSPRLFSLRGEPLFLADPGTPIGWHILFFGTYEPQLRSLLSSVLRSGCVALDVGANVGWHTLLMAKCVGSEGRVLAFEPNPTVRDVLCTHQELNMFTQIEVLPYALTDHNGEVAFVGAPAGDPGSGDGFLVGEEKQSAANLLQVEARALDELLPTLGLDRLDFVKLDIEGFEYSALLGMKATIARFRPLIALEFNEDYLPRSGATREQIGELLTELSYQTFVTSRLGLLKSSASCWPNCCDLVAVPLSKC